MFPVRVMLGGSDELYTRFDQVIRLFWAAR